MAKSPIATPAEARALHQPEEEEEEHEAEDEDRDADVADRHDIVEGERAVEPGGRGKGAGLGAEDVLRELLERDGDPEGGKERLERAPVEVADHEPLHRDAGREGDGEGQGQGHDERERVVRDDLLDDVARVGAHHDELAMRHVDYAHHAEGDGEADGREEVDRGERERVEREVGRLHDAHLHGDGRKGIGGGGRHLRVGVGVDVGEAVRGEGGGHLGIGRGGGNGTGRFERGIRAVAFGLGGKCGHRDAAHRAARDVGDERGALFLPREAGGRHAGGHEKVVGLGLGQVGAGGEDAGDVGAGRRIAREGGAAGSDDGVQRRAQVEPEIAAEAFDGCDAGGGIGIVLDGEEAFEAFLAGLEGGVGLGADRLAEGFEVFGRGIARDRFQRVGAAGRVGVGELEADECRRDEFAHARVGAKLGHVAAGGGAGIGSVEGAEGPAVAVARDEEEGAVGLADAEALFGPGREHRRGDGIARGGKRVDHGPDRLARRLGHEIAVPHEDVGRRLRMRGGRERKEERAQEAGDEVAHRDPRRSGRGAAPVEPVGLPLRSWRQ